MRGYFYGEKNIKRKTKKRRIFVSALSSILVMLTAVTPALTYAENSNENLDQGTYRLTETKTTDGHQLLAKPIMITLPLEMTDTEVAAMNNIDISKADHIDGKYYFYDLTYEISNNATLSLPKTGNNGVKLFIFMGFAVITFFITYTVMTKSFAVQTKKKGKKMERKNSFIALIYIWLPRVFGCHQKPERSFRYHGKQFPLCARCTGELAGILICAILFWFWHPSLIISVIMMIPMLIDGFTQRFTTYESTNIRRFITGFLFGIGITSLFSWSVLYTFSNGYKYGIKIGKALKK